MADNANSAQAPGQSQLQNQVEWLDEERRKANRKLAEMEQKFALQERELSGREQRIKELEKQLASLSAQVSRLPQIDVKLNQFKDEVVQLIEQYDQRRVNASEEQDRVRRVEHESTAREIAGIRKELPAINRLTQEMELRQTEEARLANLIGQQKNKLSELLNRVEEWERSMTFLEEKEKQNNRNISDLQHSILEINKRWEPMQNRLDAMADKVVRLENRVQAMQEAQERVEDNIKGWMEQIQVGEHERNKRLENWRYVLEEYDDTMEQFRKEWVTFSDQYKEAKMAVDTLTEWQERIEKQQQETAEMMRIDSRRMQSRWDNFQQESEKRWRKLEVEIQQRWQKITRQERQVQGQINEVEEQLEALKQEKDRLDRIQSAQSDAIKKLPRIWLEEIEKAIAQDPNRRRAPALVPVREE